VHLVAWLISVQAVFGEPVASVNVSNSSLFCVHVISWTTAWIDSWLVSSEVSCRTKRPLAAFSGHVVWFNVTDSILSVTSNYIFLMLPMVNVESST